MATLDNTAISLSDVTHDAVSRVWNAVGNEISRSQKLIYDYPLNRDSVAITLTAVNPYTTEITLRLISDGIYAPSIITPNLSQNNYFQVVGNSLIDGEIWIFDRRGAQAWRSNDIHARWMPPTKAPLPQATYVYTLRYRQVTDPDAWLSKTVTVTLIR
jgi:hypothetical protein